MTTERLAEWVSDQFETISAGVPITFIRIEADDSELLDTVFIPSEQATPELVMGRIEKRLNNIVPGLRVGQHVLRFVTVNSENTPVSTHRHIVSGSAPVQKKAPPAEESLARAMSQLSDLFTTHTRGLQDFADQALTARREGVANELVQHESLLLLQTQMAELVNDQKNKEAKRELLVTYGEQLGPVLGMLINKGVEWFESAREKNKLEIERMKAAPPPVPAKVEVQETSPATPKPVGAAPRRKALGKKQTEKGNP